MGDMVQDSPHWMKPFLDEIVVDEIVNCFG